jgi:hypothetical protein
MQKYKKEVNNQKKRRKKNMKNIPENDLKYLLFDFFMWFRENGEKHIEKPVEEMIGEYLKCKV